jgi:hypothetical protein
LTYGVGDTGDRWTAARIIHAHGGERGENNLNDEQMGGADDEESLYVTHNIMISVRPIENWLFDVDGPGFFF